MARFDAKHLKALKEEPTLRIVRAQMMDAASETIAGERTRDKAIWLAVLLGWCGAHRYYLGQVYYGLIYAIWFLTASILLFVHRSSTIDWGGCIITIAPWIVALVEAFQLSKMSRVTFNLTYNIERVIEKLPPDAPPSPVSVNAVFSMEEGEEPLEPDEGFEDELSSIKLRTIARSAMLNPSADGSDRSVEQS
jgi:hypothetical protein